jgi:hypothetical protein
MGGQTVTYFAQHAMQNMSVFCFFAGLTVKRFVVKNRKLTLLSVINAPEFGTIMVPECYI